jgi:hypothetical protein
MLSAFCRKYFGALSEQAQRVAIRTTFFTGHSVYGTLDPCRQRNCYSPKFVGEVRDDRLRMGACSCIRSANFDFTCWNALVSIMYAVLPSSRVEISSWARRIRSSVMGWVANALAMKLCLCLLLICSLSRNWTNACES